MTCEQISSAILVALALVLAGAAALAIRMRALGRRNAELEQLLAERTASLEQKSRELDAANEQYAESERAKSRFLANVTHELKTPLNSILGFSELLLDEVGSIPAEKQTRFLGNVRRSAQHLLSQINDVLDISKIETGRMEVHVDRVTLAPIIASTLESVADFASPRRISLQADVEPDLPVVFADAVKVRQILYNLLSNAIRFSVAGGSVELVVRLLELASSPLGSDTIEIKVTDHGSGIPEAELHKIFGPTRPQSIASSLGLGTGLGLAIVRLFSELQGGRVSVDSRPGEGCAFRVWLPLDAREFDTDKISMTS